MTSTEPPPAYQASSVRWHRYHRVVSTAATLGVILAGYFILSAGKNFLVPLVTAFIVVYLVSVLNRQIAKVRLAGRALPPTVSSLISFIVIIAAVYALFAIVADNAGQVAAAAPRYQNRLQQLQQEVFTRLGIEEPPELRDLVKEMDLRALFTAIAASVAHLLESITLVFIYGLFMLLEFRYATVKLNALFPDPLRRERALRILRRIDHDIHTYLSVKTAVSFATALLSYFLLRLVGVDFAEFWALLIFIFHFIPTFGVIFATLLPTLLAAVEFDHLGPFLIVGLGLAAIAQFMGNIVEPNVMGESLNLSPLAVIMALIFWGTLWGVTGAFLCVPLTVMVVIILSNFEATRWVAVLLSKTGTIGPGEEAVRANPRHEKREWQRNLGHRAPGDAPRRNECR
ncbi:MAG: AI-2E family transporter [Verrucomicrobia bacterium]|nr:AI-2E family transporter [Verrucomicrobiota bacterium]